MAEKSSEIFSENAINPSDEGSNTPPQHGLDEYDILRNSSEDEVLIDKPTEDEVARNKPESVEKPNRPRALSTKSVDVVTREITCPRVNCPEKIVICLDLSSEMSSIILRSRSGDKFAPIKLVKRALGIFCHTKHQVDKRHQFAIVVLHERGIWVRPFTSNPKEVITFLDDLNDTYPCETFNLTSLFDEVHANIKLPHVENPTVVPPPYVVRMILIYGRSHCIPEFKNGRESYKLLRSSPYFFLDVFYVHEPPSDDNKCEDVFDSLCDLDEHGLSYIMEVSKNLTKLYDHMIQLASHPLQRPLQKDCHYKLKERES
ncbi:BRISC and BRCA1-A complex member 1-like [Lineus longissimus]|uniref:BRISC and BRCA1-A complex member 1-like n=1 Tax=Lineus longissimus TaxID=88925 RepID=UPI002B4F8E47